MTVKQKQVETAQNIALQRLIAAVTAQAQAIRVMCTCLDVVREVMPPETRERMDQIFQTKTLEELFMQEGEDDPTKH